MAARDNVQLELTDDLTTPANEASRAVVSDAVRVVARGRSLVRASGDSAVTAHDEARVENGDHDMRGTITLYDRTTLRWRGAGGFAVVANDNERVVVEATDRRPVQVEATGDATVEVIRGCAHVVLRDRARAVVGNDCVVRAYHKSAVKAHGTARVELHDEATVKESGWEVVVRDERHASQGVS